MLVLFENAAGLALLKVLDEKKLKDVESLQECFESTSTAKKLLKLKAFSKFENTADALATAAALVDSKLSKGAKKFLKKQVVDKETLAVADAKLGNLIKEKLGIPCVHSAAVMELIRGVRTHLSDVVTKLDGVDMRPMSLGLSHSLSRFKLKFSPDKVDTMIVQAIGLLDELDKELNTYAMRTREWYGWHFPEMTKIVADNIEYAKVVNMMGTRDRADGIDFSGVLQEEVESEMKAAAVISMGTDISEEDMQNIKHLCDQVVSLSEYRAQLYDYLRSRMQAIAPNLTVLVGELVGARLIAHAGSLMSLAKHPASTVQILGAEKALFRALKTKHETPKYGLIYHASLIGQAAPKFKGKISRVLAAKCSLSIRMDALGETSEPTVGIENRAKVEARLRQLEGRALASTPGTKGKTDANGDATRYETPASSKKKYNTDADVVMADTVEDAKKKKKKKHTDSDDEDAEGEEDRKKDKKKKKKKEENGDAAADDEGEKKKKKKKKHDDDDDEDDGSKSAKKKKKKQKTED